MTNIRQQNYRAMRVHSHSSSKNVLQGIAETVEKPVNTLFKSFWNVLTSPVEGNLKVAK